MGPAPAFSGVPTAGRRGGVDLAEIFLFPVRALAMVFRAKHLEALDRAASSGELTLPDSPSQPGAFPAWLAALRQHDWVVYAKPPFAGPEQVLQYLGRYTHRVALSNERLVDLLDRLTAASQEWITPAVTFRDTLGHFRDLPGFRHMRVSLTHGPESITVSDIVRPAMPDGRRLDEYASELCDQLGRFVAATIRLAPSVNEQSLEPWDRAARYLHES